MDLIGRTISHYKIFEKLGEGGLGVVYKAKDTKLKRFVALKFLPPHVTREQTDRARFLQEAQAAAALNHANVCTIHEIHDEGEHPFIVMEHVEGATLRKLIRDAGDSPIPMETVLEVVLQIGEALYTAHDKGVVHRDVKSENIMVSDTGQVKVMDFGLARVYGSERLTKSSSTIGTVAYMSPERIQGQEVDARSDIFSFGVVLYEMLAGRLPFTGEYESSMMYAIVNEEPEPIQKYRSGLSSEMMHVLNRALEKQPADRYQTMSDVLIDLKRLKRDSESTGRKASDFSGSGRPAMAGAQSGISDGADAPLAVAGLHDVQHPSKREDRGGRKSRWVVPGIVGLLMIAAATWIFIIGPRIGTGLTENRIAVAYFENETGDPAFDRLERLTAETLTHELGQLTFLEVVPLVQDEAVVALLNGMDRLEALAERTKAGLVVSGTLFLEDGRLSIRPQVTDMSTQKILRSLPVISGPVNGSRMITEEMIQKILGLLAFKFQNVWTTNFHLTSTTPNYRAWREYNEGCELFFRTEFDEAIARFSRAYEFDPEFSSVGL